MKSRSAASFFGSLASLLQIGAHAERRQALATRWLINAARSRAGKSMEQKLAAELLDAANNVGNAVRRKEETHGMAEANRAFVHYRW